MPLLAPGPTLRRSVVRSFLWLSPSELTWQPAQGVQWLPPPYLRVSEQRQGLGRSCSLTMPLFNADILSLPGTPGCGEGPHGPLPRGGRKGQLLLVWTL